jgi:hypothetical protein
MKEADVKIRKESFLLKSGSLIGLYLINKKIQTKN